MLVETLLDVISGPVSAHQHLALRPPSVLVCLRLELHGPSWRFRLVTWDMVALHSISACPGVLQQCMLSGPR